MTIMTKRRAILCGAAAAAAAATVAPAVPERDLTIVPVPTFKDLHLYSAWLHWERVHLVHAMYGEGGSGWDHFNYVPVERAVNIATADEFAPLRNCRHVLDVVGVDRTMPVFGVVDDAAPPAVGAKWDRYTGGRQI